MNKQKFIQFTIALSFVLICTTPYSNFLVAQYIPVPLESRIYEFLEQMDLKGLIRTDAEVKPFSRKYITEKLLEVKSRANKLNFQVDILNSVERDELEFWMKEFSPEIKKILNSEFSVSDSGSFRNTDSERWNLWDYSDKNFYIRLNPIVGYGVSTTGNNNGYMRWWGASLFASYSDWFGATINLRDKGEFGDNVDRDKEFSPLRGAWVKGAPNGIEYTDIIGSISFDWNWGSISLIKDYLQWGSGQFGQLILSDKAPSYPHIRLQLKPTEWLRFNYIHGWLNSLVHDSSGFYYSYPESLVPRLRKEYIPKFIAANMFTFSAFSWLDVSAGNSIVYSGDLRPEFFIPFMFFKFLDHNTGRGDVGDGNGQMYFDVSLRYPDTYKFYTTLFVDVTEIRNILENDFSNTWIGFTLGGKKIDLFIPNLDLTAEYTVVSPWVYEHKDEVTTYKHINYYLGHWIGQNADQLRVQLNYRILRGLHTSLFFERIRKGGLEDIYYAYGGMNEKDLPFLYEPLRKDLRIGFNINYELIHDLNISASYLFTDIKDNDTGVRTPAFISGKKHSFGLTVYFNL